MENSNVDGGAQKLTEVLKSRRARSNIRGLKVDRAQGEVGKNFGDGKLEFIGVVSFKKVHPHPPACGQQLVCSSPALGRA